MFSDCKFNCHKKCAPQVPKNCQGEVKWVAGSSKSSWLHGCHGYMHSYFTLVEIKVDSSDGDHEVIGHFFVSLSKNKLASLYNEINIQ